MKVPQIVPQKICKHVLALQFPYPKGDWDQMRPRGTAETKYGQDAVPGVRPNTARSQFQDWDQMQPVLIWLDFTTPFAAVVSGISTGFDRVSESCTFWDMDDPLVYFIF